MVVLLRVCAVTLFILGSSIIIFHLSQFEIYALKKTYIPIQQNKARLAHKSLHTVEVVSVEIVHQKKVSRVASIEAVLPILNKREKRR